MELLIDEPLRLDVWGPVAFSESAMPAATAQSVFHKRRSSHSVNGRCIGQPFQCAHWPGLAGSC